MVKKTNFVSILKDKFDDIDKILITEPEILTPVSTGLLSLDASIGIGGFPRRRYSVIDGPESSGKTTIALSSAREVIKNGGKVLFVDVENQSPVDLINDLTFPNAVQDEKIYLVKPDSAEDSFNVAEAGIESKEFDLIIFDSIGALAPVEEQDKKFEQGSMAIVPRLLGKFLRRNKTKIRINNLAFVFINQVRDSMNSYARAYSTPGGHALKHFATVIISLTKGDQIKQGNDIVGINTKFLVKKNKLAPPFRSYTIPIIFGTGVDTMRDFVQFATTIGAIKRSGPYYKFGDESIGLGLVGTMQYLKETPQILDKIKEVVYNTVGCYKGEVVDIEEQEEYEEEFEN